MRCRVRPTLWMLVDSSPTKTPSCSACQRAFFSHRSRRRALTATLPPAESPTMAARSADCGLGYRMGTGMLYYMRSIRGAAPGGGACSRLDAGSWLEAQELARSRDDGLGWVDVKRSAAAATGARAAARRGRRERAGWTTARLRTSEGEGEDATCAGFWANAGCMRRCRGAAACVVESADRCPSSDAWAHHRPQLQRPASLSTSPQTRHPTRPPPSPSPTSSICARPLDAAPTAAMSQIHAMSDDQVRRCPAHRTRSHARPPSSS